MCLECHRKHFSSPIPLSSCPFEFPNVPGFLLVHFCSLKFYCWISPRPSLCICLVFLPCIRSTCEEMLCCLIPALACILGANVQGVCYTFDGSAILDNLSWRSIRNRFWAEYFAHWCYTKLWHTNKTWYALLFKDGYQPPRQVWRQHLRKQTRMGSCGWIHVRLLPWGWYAWMTVMMLRRLLAIPGSWLVISLLCLHAYVHVSMCVCLLWHFPNAGVDNVFALIGYTGTIPKPESLDFIPAWFDLCLSPISEKSEFILLAGGGCAQGCVLGDDRKWSKKTIRKVCFFVLWFETAGWAFVIAIAVVEYEVWRPGGPGGARWHLGGLDGLPHPRSMWHRTIPFNPSPIGRRVKHVIWPLQVGLEWMHANPCCKLSCTVINARHSM